ncbi:hypothetical protein [Solibacillus sp. FSL K6-4121]
MTSIFVHGLGQNSIEKSTNKIVEKQVEQNKLLEEIKAKLKER